MTKRYIFNGEEGNAFIGQSLVPYLGIIALHNNYSDILKGVYEGLLCHHVNYPYQELAFMLEEYGVPPDHAVDIISGVRVLLGRYITSMVPGIGERIFEVVVNPTFDVHVLDTGSVEELERRQMNPEDYFRQQILDSVANGDWVNENLRRMAGI